MCFYSKFVPNPNSDNQLEFPTDPDIKKRIQDWRGCFLSMLIDYHNKGPLTEAPEEFQEIVEQYVKRSFVRKGAQVS